MLSGELDGVSQERVVESLGNCELDIFVSVLEQLEKK